MVTSATFIVHFPAKKTATASPSIFSQYVSFLSFFIFLLLEPILLSPHEPFISGLLLLELVYLRSFGSRRHLQEPRIAFGVSHFLDSLSFFTLVLGILSKAQYTYSFSNTIPDNITLATSTIMKYL